MNDEDIEIKMVESALAWASENPITGYEDLVSSAILRLQTAATPYPWLVQSAVARLQQMADLLSDEKQAEHPGQSGFGERRFNVYSDIQTGTLASAQSTKMDSSAIIVVRSFIGSTVRSCLT